MLHHFTERIQVKCNQTGKIFRAKISSLSKDDIDSSLSAADLAQGSQLIMDFEKKSYPVTVMKVTDEPRNGMCILLFVFIFDNQILYHLKGTKKKITMPESQPIEELSEIIDQAKSAVSLSI